MRVLGKFVGGNNGCLFAIGGYVALEAEWIHVETYTGKSVEEDKKCFLSLGSSYYTIEIKSSNGDYLTPEFANMLVREIALREITDLDAYDMGFFEVMDIRPDSICVRNEVDEDYNAIPLEVSYNEN